MTSDERENYSIAVPECIKNGTNYSEESCELDLELFWEMIDES